MIFNCFVKIIKNYSTDYAVFWIYSENDIYDIYKTFYLAFYYTNMCNKMMDMHLLHEYDN